MRCTQRLSSSAKALGLRPPGWSFASDFATRGGTRINHEDVLIAMATEMRDVWPQLRESVHKITRCSGRPVFGLDQFPVCCGRDGCPHPSDLLIDSQVAPACGSEVQNPQSLNLAGPEDRKWFPQVCVAHAGDRPRPCSSRGQLPGSAELPVLPALESVWRLQLH